MNKQKFWEIDFVMFISMVLLLVFGLVMIYSTTINATTALEGRGAFQLQLIYAVLGLFLYVVFTYVNYRILKPLSIVLYVLTILSLLAVLVIGDARLGARRWINLGFTSLQPSEFAKFSLLIVLCAVMANRSRFASAWHFIGLASVILIPPAVLILVEPDLGTAIVLLVLWFGMLVGIGVPWKHLLLIAVTSVAGGPLMWPRLKPYQQERILIFLDPSRDAKGTGYNVLQALVAIGAGGVFGVGLGQGTQSQYKFLPVRHTDFIFSVIAEELGMVGAVILIALYVVLLWRILHTASRATDNFARFLAIGAFVVIFAQAFINIAMNLNIMPVTGIPLPFISAGGSSLWVTMAMVGLVQGLNLHRDKKVGEVQATINTVGLRKKV